MNFSTASSQVWWQSVLDQVAQPYEDFSLTRAPTTPTGKGKGKGKGGRGSSKSVSSSSKAGLQFPVARVGRYLKKGGYASRVGVGAGVYVSNQL